MNKRRKQLIIIIKEINNYLYNLQTFKKMHYNNMNELKKKKSDYKNCINVHKNPCCLVG